MFHNGNYLIVKKKSAGFWSGLWIFPMVRILKTSDVEKKIHKIKKKSKINNLKRLDIVNHAFSHFNIRANLILLSVTKSSLQNNSRWVSKEKALRMAIPKFVDLVFKKI